MSAFRILIAGCGYVGQALCEILTQKGHQVWSLRRRPGVTANACGMSIQADLTDPTSLLALPQGLDYIFYTASADGRREDAYRNAYFVGMSSLLEALEMQRITPDRIFFTSSTSVYTQDDGEWVDETSLAQPSSTTAQILRETEQLLQSSVFRTTIVRLSGIYGPGRTRLMDTLRTGRAPLDRDAMQWTNRIHRDDCAGLLAHLMECSSVASLYVGTDNEPALLGEVLRWIANLLGVLAPAPVAQQNSHEQICGKRCSNKLLVGSGYRLIYPTFREGYSALNALRHDPR